MSATQSTPNKCIWNLRVSEHPRWWCVLFWSQLRVQRLMLGSYHLCEQAFTQIVFSSVCLQWKHGVLTTGVPGKSCKVPLLLCCLSERKTAPCQDLPVWLSSTPTLLFLWGKLGPGSSSLSLCLLSSPISDTWDRSRRAFVRHVFPSPLRNVVSLLFLRSAKAMTWLPFLPCTPPLELHYFWQPIPFELWLEAWASSLFCWNWNLYFCFLFSPLLFFFQVFFF